MTSGNLRTRENPRTHDRVQVSRGSHNCLPVPFSYPPKPLDRTRVGLKALAIHWGSGSVVESVGEAIRWLGCSIVDLKVVSSDSEAQFEKVQDQLSSPTDAFPSFFHPSTHSPLVHSATVTPLPQLAVVQHLQPPTVLPTYSQWYWSLSHCHVITTDWRAPIVRQDSACTATLNKSHDRPPHTAAWHTPIHTAGAIPTKSCAPIATLQQRYHHGTMTILVLATTKLAQQ
ncbi:hypothetical protein EDB89DRAFT_1905608 [Lactarius sanguifluus]|nr:hypothetical protein EDB89DRAFT_1905608 [Lactarius sanguifluus]